MKKTILGLAMIGAMSMLMAEGTQDGEHLYKKCAGCHGAKGEKKALGKSEVIKDMTKDEIVESMKGYREGTVNRHGMGMLMKGQAASLSDDDIKTIAEYIGEVNGEEK